MAKVRVEWVRLSAPGYGRGAEANDLSAILAAQVLSVSSTPLQSAAAPNFGDGLVGFARVGGITGAVNVAWGGGVAGETLGVRIAAGQTVLIEVGSGQTLSLVEAADPPSAASTQDSAAETTLAAIQTALNGTLDVAAHPVQAEATSRSGTITAGGTPQDLMPANSAPWSMAPPSPELSCRPPRPKM